MKKKLKLVSGMSGGVDSTVATAYYINQGHEVIGVTLQMLDEKYECEETKSCCGKDDNIRTRELAKYLNIEHKFVDVKDLFKEQVLEYTWNEYANGRTPNPCVQCNKLLKFGALLKYADEIGADGVITGHYAIIREDTTGNKQLIQGIDKTKNQTYFLAMLSQEQLNRCYMPLGELTKDKVREIARELGLENSDKKDSQDACFGNKGEKFSATLSRILEKVLPQGKIKTEDEKVVAEHQGIHNFTIGQRKGHGVALGKPAYVVDIRAQENEIILSTDKTLLLSNGLIADRINWLVNDLPDSFECTAQIRYNQKPLPAKITKLPNDEIQVNFFDSVRAITPGQVVALYRDDLVLGGAWIKTKL